MWSGTNNIQLFNNRIQKFISEREKRTNIIAFKVSLENCSSDNYLLAQTNDIIIKQNHSVTR